MVITNSPRKRYRQSSSPVTQNGHHYWFEGCSNKKARKRCGSSYVSRRKMRPPNEGMHTGVNVRPENLIPGIVPAYLTYNSEAAIEITGHRNRPSRVRFCRLLCLSRTNSRFLEFLDLRRGAGQIPKARKEIEEPHSLLRCLGNHAQASTLSRRRYPPTSWIVRKSAVRLI